MRIYVDEAGSFIPPASLRPAFSLVLALLLPTAAEKGLFYDFLRLRDTWPNQKVEIKGSSLNERQAAEVVRLALRYDALVKFVALDTSTHPDSLVTDFKGRQADAVTANITRDHKHPGPILHLHQLGEAIRGMSNQLFLQTFATWQLIIQTIREGTLYFVQRQPQELGDIAWVIDRKDRAITAMEDTWSTLILPMSEVEFARKPLAFLKGADYSYFDARYTAETADAEMLKYLQWLRSVHRLSPPKAENIIDAKKLLGPQRTKFENSRDSLGLELADMLASILRRALNDRLRFDGWKDFGGLLVWHRNPADGFIQITSSDKTIPLLGHAGKVSRVLHAKAKNMIAERLS